LYKLWGDGREGGISACINTGEKEKDRRSVKLSKDQQEEPV